jgi:hypothetical protein
LQDARDIFIEWVILRITLWAEAEWYWSAVISKKGSAQDKKAL